MYGYFFASKVLVKAFLKVVEPLLNDILAVAVSFESCKSSAWELMEG